MSYLHKLKSRKGLTLVEVMIALVIFSIILLAAFSLYTPIQNVAQSVRTDSDMQRVVSSAENYVSWQLRNAIEIEMLWDTALNPTSLYQTMYDFVMPPGGTTDDNKNKQGDNPSALVIRGGYLYNIPLLNNGNIPLSTTEIAAAMGSTAIEKYRVFSRSFYGGNTLEFNLEFTPELPTSQIRGKTYLMLQIDALDENGDVNLSSRSLAEIPLTWIGNIYTANGATDVRELRARTNPQTAVNGSATGDLVILYHNNVNFVHRGKQP